MFNLRSFNITFVLYCLLIPGIWLFTTSAKAQDFKTVRDGIEYSVVRREFSGKPVNINLLKLDLTKVRIDVHHAMDAAIGTEKTSSIAIRQGAVAAINAGFFRLDTSIFAGDAAGALTIDGRRLSESTNDRVVLFITNKPERSDTYIAPLQTYDMVQIKKWDLLLSGINRERKADELVMFTPDFHRTTLTNGSGLELVIVGDKISEIRDLAGSTPIPTNGYVLSATGSFRNRLLPLVKKGSKVFRLSSLSRDNKGHFMTEENARISDAFHVAEDIVAGVPQLIKNGKIDITWEQEKSSKAFVETRHPRTAVAKLKDGKFLMLTADGRREASGGLDLYDLAAYLLELGATDAMNLDGGGSTTMFLDGKVVNQPSDREGERKVSDAILVTLRPPKKNK
ncbi:MAG: phosphodiester glycosidase family protein [Pyrinomonadaceae bacterium]